MDNSASNKGAGPGKKQPVDKPGASKPGADKPAAAKPAAAKPAAAKPAAAKTTGAKQTGAKKSTSARPNKKAKGVSTDPPTQDRDGHVITDLQQLFDAMFFSAEAVKTFVVPFYNKAGRATLGDRIYSAFTSHPDQVCALAHMPTCEAAFLVSDPVSRKGDWPKDDVLHILTLEEVEKLPGSADRS